MSHNKDAVQKVAFANVSLEDTVTHPKADYSTLETVLLSTDARVGYVSREHLTSPPWSRDGHALTFEVDGRQQEKHFAPLKTAAPVGPPVTIQPDRKFQYVARNKNGKLQIFRKLADSIQPEQLTSDDFNNVSPNLSPDGKFLLFLSYSKDLKGLPQNDDVALGVMSLEDKSVKTFAAFVGGEGSLGPQPWSPDGRRVAFISYQSME
jgi:Tol biopolymer transport system component